MNTKHFVNILIKILGFYFGILALEYLVDFSVHYLPSSAHRDELANYFRDVEIKSKIFKFILYLSISLIGIFKSELIGSFFTKNEIKDDENINQNIKESAGINSLKSMFLMGIKILGLIFIVVSASNLISQSYSFTLLGRGESYDLYFILGYLTNLITPVVKLIFGIILIKTPEWLIRFLRLDSL